MSFVPFFLSKNVSLSDANRMAEELREECPWMDFTDEISESIALELLGSDDKLAWCHICTPEELVDWYNKEVRRLENEGNAESEANDAYGDLCTLIEQFGVEDAFGDGDFWVVADSFSTRAASVVWFHDSPLPSGLQEALVQWKLRHPRFVSVAVGDEDGTVLLKV